MKYIDCCKCYKVRIITLYSLEMVHYVGPVNKDRH